MSDGDQPTFTRLCLAQFERPGTRLLAIDSKLRGCDVVKVRIGGRVRARATVVQQKTRRPVQFQLLESARTSVLTWLAHRGGLDDYAFPMAESRPSALGDQQG